MKCQEIDVKNEEIAAQELKIQQKDMNINEFQKEIEEKGQKILGLEERLLS